MKLDIMKAYDSVDWDFLFNIMKVMEFLCLYVHWVRQCVSSSKFSVVINGELKGYFPGRRGLRQGNPLSPYLFLLIMQAFSALLNYRVDNRVFSYHPKCSVFA